MSIPRPHSNYGVTVGAGISVGADAGVTVNPLKCGQPPTAPLPTERTPHEVKANGAAAGSVAMGAPIVGLTLEGAVAVAVGVDTAGVPDV